MTRQNRTLVLQFAFAIAVCIVIGVFDRPLIGLVGFGVCAIIFAVQATIRGKPGSASNATAVVSELSCTRFDAGTSATGESVPGCYNPDNPVLPVYYPTDRRN